MQGDPERLKSYKEQSLGQPIPPEFRKKGDVQGDVLIKIESGDREIREATLQGTEVFSVEPIKESDAIPTV